MLNTHPGAKSVFIFAAKATYVGLMIFSVVFFSIAVLGNMITRTSRDRTYTVKGSAERYVAPDKLTISLSSVVKDSTPKKVQDRASEIIEETVNAVKELGLTDEEIKTSGYNIYPEYEYRAYSTDYSEQQKIIGYSMNVQISIETKKIDKVSEILDVATSKGINQINSLNFSIDEIEKLQDELKLEAIDNAKEKAKAEAKQSGLKLGKVINVYDNSYYPVYNYSQNDYALAKETSGNESITAGSSEGSDSVSIPINPGTESITVNVSVESEIL